MARHLKLFDIHWQQLACLNAIGLHPRLGPNQRCIDDTTIVRCIVIDSLAQVSRIGPGDEKRTEANYPVRFSSAESIFFRS